MVMPEDPRDRGVTLGAGDVVGIVDDARVARHAQTRLQSRSVTDDEVEVLSGETGARLLETPRRRGLVRLLPFSGRMLRGSGSDWAEMARAAKYVVLVRGRGARGRDEAVRILRELDARRVYEVGAFGVSRAR